MNFQIKMQKFGKAYSVFPQRGSELHIWLFFKTPNRNVPCFSARTNCIATLRTIYLPSAPPPIPP